MQTSAAMGQMCAVDVHPIWLNKVGMHWHQVVDEELFFGSICIRTLVRTKTGGQMPEFNATFHDRSRRSEKASFAIAVPPLT